MIGATTCDEISVVVRGQVFTGWKSAQIVSGVNQLASQFSLSLTRKLPGGLSYDRIRPGDEVQVKVGDDLMVTGYVDKAPVSYDGNSITLSVAGRSKCGVLVDSCCLISRGEKTAAATTAGGEWSGVTTRHDGGANKLAPVKPASQRLDVDVEKAVREIVEPHGVVLVSTGLGLKAKAVTISKQQKCFDAISKLVREHSLVATDDEGGNLVLMSMDSPDEGDGALVAALDGVGTNVLSASAAFDYSTVFSAYEVYGQAKPPKNSKTPTQATNLGGKSTTKALGGQTKVLRIFESGNADRRKMQLRADYERVTREGKAKTVTYKVAGWRTSAGSLWKKGTTVKIKDELLGIDAGDAETWIIGKVAFDMSSSEGRTTTLEVAPLDAYAVQPEDWGAEKGGSKSVGATTEQWKEVK